MIDGDHDPVIRQGLVIKDNFHTRLALLRQRVASDAEMAERIGLSPAGYHRIKRGGDPSLSTLLAIANEFDVSLPWLTGGEEELPRGMKELDTWLFSRILDGIRQAYKRVGGQIQTISEVELALEIHGRITSLANDRKEQHGALLMALDQLERDLRSTKETQNDDGKRTA